MTVSSSSHLCFRNEDAKTLCFLFFSPSLHLLEQIYSSKFLIIMSEIPNVGRKGYCLMWFFIFLLLFVILVVAIYNYNFKLTF